MLLGDGVYRIVAHTSVQYCYVSNERLSFRLILKSINRNIPFKELLVEDYKIVLTLEDSRAGVFCGTDPFVRPLFSCS